MARADLGRQLVGHVQRRGPVPIHGMRLRMSARRSLRSCVAFLALLVLVGCGQDPATRKQRYLDRGVAYLESGRVNEAIIELKNAIQVDPAFAPALHTLGRAYATKFWYGDAVRELQRAVDAQPEERRFRIDLANALLELDGWNDALTQGQAILQRDPN